MKTKTLGLLAVGLLALPIASNAASFLFDVSGTFVDGGSLVGQVSIDDSSCALSSGNLSTFGGNLPAATFSGPVSSFASSCSSDGVAALGWVAPSSSLGLYFSVGAGGVVAFADLPSLTSISLLTITIESSVSDGIAAQRNLASGSLTRRASVPEPGTLALLGLGLAGLGLSWRRKAN